jgi:aminopeptidase
VTGCKQEARASLRLCLAAPAQVQHLLSMLLPCLKGWCHHGVTSFSFSLTPSSALPPSLMKNIFSTTGWLLSLLLTAGPAVGQNYEQIAKQIVNTSANVKPGELVMITGGQHTLPLMEAIAVEVARTGGEPAMLVNTDKVERAGAIELPESAIQASKANNWVLQSDVLITLPSVEDSKAVLAGLTEARQAKFDKAAAESGFTKKLDASKLRGVFVSYPSKSYAANQQLDYPGYEQMIWAGIATDYAAVAAQAQQMKQLLATGKKVHITSPAGTDLTFALAARPVM